MAAPTAYSLHHPPPPPPHAPPPHAPPPLPRGGPLAQTVAQPPGAAVEAENWRTLAAIMYAEGAAGFNARKRAQWKLEQKALRLQMSARRKSLARRVVAREESKRLGATAGSKRAAALDPWLSLPEPRSPGGACGGGISPGVNCRPNPIRG